MYLVFSDNFAAPQALDTQGLDYSYPIASLFPQTPDTRWLRTGYRSRIFPFASRVPGEVHLKLSFTLRRPTSTPGSVRVLLFVRPGAYDTDAQYSGARYIDRDTMWTHEVEAALVSNQDGVLRYSVDFATAVQPTGFQVYLNSDVSAMAVYGIEVGDAYLANPAELRAPLRVSNLVVDDFQQESV